MKTITSQTWRRRIDRAAPQGRSREWVPTVAQGHRTLDPDVVRNFERIVQRIRVQKSQNSSS
ncbi:hypothetical protein UFOVP841_20 [uncultured Caudovirales phage]|uniref:Uncharacterized protein n=1 Tax=uncultured Caudovirales phage TaxID=2100421 RepID=A0A6J5PAE7_9CAUD|nr:hypothetical protein UFOVP841_20 [uncultured Caudovirales phage]